MRDGLLQLLKLQEVDRELQALEEAKEKYPTEIGQRQSEIERARASLEEQQEQLATLAKKQRHIERELESARASLQEHEGRFAEVTTNKEYDALQLEIEACKARISEYETQILDIINASERLGEQVESEKEEFEEIRQAQQGRIDELQEKLASMQQQVDGVEVRRQKVTQSIDQKLLTLYERRRGPRGSRVAAMRKGACGSCYRELPAQQKSEVRRSERLIQCENCGAILVWDEESS